MRFSLLVLLSLLLLVQLAESKGRGAGGRGGGFKLSSSKKQTSRATKAKQQPSKTSAKTRAIDGDKKSYEPPKDYGLTFASGLSKNSYIYNNYYRTSAPNSRGIMQFLTGALFLRNGIKVTREISQYDEWDDADDQFWRLTTRAPFFENKIPGE